jgi:energy-coupling factor transporter transmembrane protein EcfT
MKSINNKNTKPLSFENKTFSVFLFIIIFAELIFLGNLFNYFGFNPATIIVSQLIGDANTNRSQNGLSVLVENEVLNKAAEMKAKDMAEKSYFSHTTPENRKFTYFLDTAGYDFKYAGENLAVTQQNTEDVAKAWMESPTHRANILRSKYNEIGMAMATGTYKNAQVVFIAQYFGTKSSDIKTAVNKQTGAVLDAFIGKDTSSAEIEANDVENKTFVLGAEAERTEKSSSIFNMIEEKFSYPYVVKILWILFVIFALIFLVGFFSKIECRTTLVNTFFLLTILTMFLIINWYVLFNNNSRPEFIDDIKFAEETR